MTTLRTNEGAGVALAGLDELLERLERGEFDLVAVGRSIIVNPDWPKQVRQGHLNELRPFHRDALAELV
jgi:2,4-dienoyl-CoA reductase-like NADH-dependent reductase (Old Yellow Enzyme family)